MSALILGESHSDMNTKAKAKGYRCFEFSRNKDKALCQVKYCGKLRAPGRCVCYAHHILAWRLNHPLKSAYATLRDHAKRRKVKFDLTLKQFEKLVVASGWLENKGTTREALQLDRINPMRGYEFDNLRVITCSENAAKGASEDKRFKQEHADDLDDIYFPPDVGTDHPF